MRVTMVFDEVKNIWCPICGQKLDPKNLGSGCGHLYNYGRNIGGEYGFKVSKDFSGLMVGWIEFRSEKEEAK